MIEPIPFAGLIDIGEDMTINHKESCLDDQYELSQKDIADKMFLAVGTVASTEKRAMEKVKQALEAKGITAKDILE